MRHENEKRASVNVYGQHSCYEWGGCDTTPDRGVESKGVGDRKGVPHPTVRVRARACFAPEVSLE